MTIPLQFVPELRVDFLRRDIDGEAVVWSPLVGEPTVLDPAAAVMLGVIDGDATVAQLATDVHEVVGVDLAIAQQEVARIIERLGTAGLLTSSRSETSSVDAIAERELFVNPCTNCMKNAASGMTTVGLLFGDLSVSVACYPPRAARKLSNALSDRVVPSKDDAEIGFMLTGPAGLRRTHELADRSGFVHSRGRGTNSGLHALASQLTAFLPPPAGTVRVRAGAVASKNRVVVCLFPLLLVPTIDEAELVGAGYGLVDRLAIDIDVATGNIVNQPIPWPTLAALDPGPGHLGPIAAGPVTDVVSAAPPPGSPSPRRAAAVVGLAAGALHGSPQEILDASIRLLESADHRTAQPEDNELVELLLSLN